MNCMVTLLYQLRICKRPLSFKFLHQYSQLHILCNVIVFTWITTFVYALFASITGQFPLITSSSFCDTRCHTYMYSRSCKWSNTRRSSLFSSLRCRCLEQVNSWASDHLLTFPSSIQVDLAIGSGPKNVGSSLLTRATVLLWVSEGVARVQMSAENELSGSECLADCGLGVSDFLS